MRESSPRMTSYCEGWYYPARHARWAWVTLAGDVLTQSAYREGDFCRRMTTMRAARDLILVVCAVISTVCLVYIAINLDSIWADSTTSETAAAPDAER